MNTRTVKVERELDEQFFGDCLVTAFDGGYGGCWMGEWCQPATGSYLAVKDSSVPPVDQIWTSVSIQMTEETGDEKIDEQQTFTVTHETLRVGIQRIIDGDPAIRDDLRDQVVRAVLENMADIDAHAIDCVVQAGLFGKVYFG